MNRSEIIEILREVDIAGKTYEQYIEALANQINNKVLMEIIEDVELAVYKLTPGYMRLFPIRSHETLCALRDKVSQQQESEDEE